MHEVPIGDATQQLVTLVEAAIRGEVVLITSTDHQTVQLVPVNSTKKPRRAGSAKGLIHMADDFDAPLDDFQEYTTP
jgi:antitoxin (DNA-binding transcriptional repressor) of toxin-antitoxin stability system